MDGTREQGRGARGVDFRAATWLAWPVWALIIATIGLGFLLWPVSEGALIPLVLSTAVPFATVGAIVASRRPYNPVGWLFIAFGAAAALRFTGSQYATYALLNHPGSLPAGDLIASFAIHLWHPALGLLIFNFLLFTHDGRLLSLRWRLVAWVSAISCMTALISGMLESEFLYGYTWPEDLSFVKPLCTGPIAEIAATVFWYSSTVIIAMLFASAGSLVLRLRRSVGKERKQLKWVVYSVALLAFTLPATILVIITLPALGDARILFAFLFPLMPISVGIAILKYRLYDIDLLINRTLVYGSLTAMLALVYFGGVAATETLFRSLTGQQQQPQLAIVFSTLVIAALFNPLRRRIQSFIERRFYCSKYDARKTLEAFSARLRDETDLDALNDELVGLVRETIQPAHVSLWLRPGTPTNGKHEAQPAISTGAGRRPTEGGKPRDHNSAYSLGR